LEAVIEMDPPALHLMLSNVPLLAHMAEADRERITSQLQSTHFAEGECIISEGTLGESLMIVAEGVAVAEIKGEEVMRYVAGDYFGELSLLTGAPRQATVRAVGGSCQCLLLQREQFEMLEFNEEMWRERQERYEIANAQRIAQFFATSSSEEDDDSEDEDTCDTRPVMEAVPPASEETMQNVVARLTSERDELAARTRTMATTALSMEEANADLRQRLVLAELGVERAEVQTERAQLNKEAIELSLRGELEELRLSHHEQHESELHSPRRQQAHADARQTLMESMEVVRRAEAVLEGSASAHHRSLQAQVGASAEQITILTAANAKLSELLKASVAAQLESSRKLAQGDEQQHATVRECEAIINRLRANLAAELSGHEETVTNLRAEIRSHEDRIQRLERALSDVHHQSAARERLLHDAVNVRAAAQMNLDRHSREVGSPTAQQLRQAESWQDRLSRDRECTP
jgi:CRP-like cAMP-binding protein